MIFSLFANKKSNYTVHFNILCMINLVMVVRFQAQNQFLLQPKMPQNLMLDPKMVKKMTRNNYLATSESVKYTVDVSEKYYIDIVQKSSFYVAKNFFNSLCKV